MEIGCLPEDVLLSVFSALDVREREHLALVSKAWNRVLHSQALAPTTLTVSLAQSINLRLLRRHPSVCTVRVCGLNDLWVFEAKRKSGFELWTELLNNLDFYVAGTALSSLHIDCSLPASQQYTQTFQSVQKPQRKIVNTASGTKQITRITITISVSLLYTMERQVIFSVLDTFTSADEIYFDCKRVLLSTWNDFLHEAVRRQKVFRVLSLPDLADLSVTALFVGLVKNSGDQLTAFSFSRGQVDYTTLLQTVLDHSPSIKLLLIANSVLDTTAWDLVTRLQNRGCSVLTNKE